MGVFSVKAWRAYFRGGSYEPGPEVRSASLAIGAVLSVAGLVGVASAAGWGEVLRAAERAHWQFLAIAPGAVVISHLAYAAAYRQVAKAAGGPHLSVRDVLAIVAAGFGPVSPRRGFALDADELCKRGLSREDADLRVRVLGVLEYAVLAPATFGAAVFMVVEAFPAQAGLLPSWLIGFPAGTAVAVVLLVAFRRAGRPESWWRPLRSGLLAMDNAVELLVRWPAGLVAMAGMVVYWACEITALMACLEVFFHHHGGLAVVIVGYSTGYALTRRALPLGSAGVVEALLPFALSWVGFPLAPAVLGVVAYRAFNLWLAMLPAALGVRRLADEPATNGAGGRSPLPVL